MIYGVEADATVFVHVIGISRVGQKRHVAEDIVKDVRLLEIIELRPARG